VALPMVAIVGRPNVGKSTLFNRITGSRSAVVHEEAGVTRDRHVRPADWNGLPFLLVDTGGMVPVPEGDLFESEITAVAKEAIAQADVLLFMVDVHNGITQADEAIARELRGIDKPVHLVVNKLEREGDLSDAAIFHRLGLGEPHPVSALHGVGTGDLLDVLTANLPVREPEPPVDLRVALLGRPNVGKSSLLNTLVGETRALVSDVPGTTRDAIDTDIKWHGHSVRLVDTAGIRRRSNHQKGVEYFSVLRSIQALERCDVAILLLDATSGVVAQDARIAGEIHDAGKGVVVVWNKWDLIHKDDRTYLEFSQKVKDDLAFLPYAPVFTISATERTRTGRILETAWRIHREECLRKVETSRLNEVLERAVAANPPKVHRNTVGKIFYATQTGTAPPEFTLFVNRPQAFARHYLRYLNNRIREEWPFEGTRIRIKLRERT